MNPKLETTETVKYLFDHIKSVWTLSAGALAFGVGLLGFISKESFNSPWILAAGKFIILLSLFTYLISFSKALGSHRKLITAMSNAENPNWQPAKDQQKELTKTDSLTQSVKEVRNELKHATQAFSIAGVLLVASSSLFIVLSTLLPPSKSIEVTLKNVTFITPDSRSIDITDTTVTAVEADDSTTSKIHFQIRDAVLRTT